MRISVQKLKILLTQLTIMASFSAFSAEIESLPTWISKVPTDELYYYSVGLGEASSEVESLKQADQDAVQKLFELVFGTRMTKELKSKEDSSGAKIETSAKSDMDLEFLDKVERVETKSYESKPGIYIGYALVKVKKTNAEKRQNASDDFYKGHSPGHLDVESNPSGATVLINGFRHGETPLSITLVPGKYIIKLSKSGFKDIEKKIEIRRKEKVSLDLELTKSMGTLEVVCAPSGSSLQIDGEESKSEQEIEPGKHIIKCSMEGYVGSEKTVKIQAGETRQIEINLKKEKVPSGKVRDEDGKLISRVEYGARELLKKENWSELIRYCRNNRIAKGWRANSLFYEGMSLESIGQYEKAYRVLEEALAIRADSLTFEYLCRVQEKLGNYEKAIKYCNQAIDKDASNYSAYIHKARSISAKARSFHGSEREANEMLASYVQASKKYDWVLREAKHICKSDKFHYARACKTFIANY